MTIGAVYAATYATMGMRFSAFGSLGVATMWSLIVSYRSPGPHDGPANVVHFVRSLVRQARQTVTGTPTDDEYVAPSQSAD